MANRIIIQGYSPGDVGYSIFQRDSDGQVYKPGAGTWEAFAQGSYANYVALEAAVDDLGRYIADIPAGINVEGDYNLIAFQRLGGAAAYGDSRVEARPFYWDGSALVLQSSFGKRIITALPNVAPNGNGGLPIISSGAIQANLSGNILGSVSGNITGSVANVTNPVTTGGFGGSADTLITALQTSINLLLTAVPDAAFIEGSVNDAGATTTAFNGDASLSATDGFYQNRWLIFTSGALKGLSQPILSYTGATRRFTFAAENAWIAAPVDTSTFIITGKA